MAMTINIKCPSSEKWPRSCPGLGQGCKTTFLATPQWPMRISLPTSTSCRTTPARGSSWTVKAHSVGLRSPLPSERPRLPLPLLWAQRTISRLHALPKTLLPRTGLPFSAGSRSTRTVTFSRPLSPLRGGERDLLKKLPFIQTCTFSKLRYDQTSL